MGVKLVGEYELTENNLKALEFMRLVLCKEWNSPLSPKDFVANLMLNPEFSKKLMEVSPRVAAMYNIGDFVINIAEMKAEFVEFWRGHKENNQQLN